MKQICILLALLAVVSCSELVVSSWTGSYNSGTEFSKVFQDCSNNDTVEIAVYGWFKVSSQFTRADWSTIFHLTSNADASFTNASKAGDRVLAFFNINNMLHTPTYTTGNSNYYQNDPSFDNTDLDKWAFFYVGTGQSKKYSYFSLPSGVKTNVLTNIAHSTSTYYKIFVGHSVQYKYFPGSLYNVYIQFGAGAYRESGYEQIITSNPNNPQIPGCPTLFSETSYSGSALNRYQSESHQDVTKIKSIYVPEGEQVSIIDNANFAGKKITFHRSIEHIDQTNWNKLINEKAITITAEKKLLKRNSSRLH